MEVDVIDNEIWAERGNLVGPTPEGPPAKEDETEEKEEAHTPFFVTVSRHSGFRRLHKVGCCGVHPWSCHKAEYIGKVTSGVADAVCKVCQKNAGGSINDADEEASSTSGSSSSTDFDDGGGEIPVDAKVRELEEIGDGL